MQQQSLHLFFYYDFSHGPFFSSFYLVMINNAMCCKNSHVRNSIQRELRISKQLKKGIITALVFIQIN